MAADSGEHAPGGAPPGFLLGGGEVGRLIRAHGWGDTALGPPRAWPAELSSLVAVMLGAAQPMFVVWGPSRVLLYNGPYAEILAAKHPAALGRDFLEVWAEIRAELAPIVARAYAGEPVRVDDHRLWTERKGFREEAHFAFSFSPVRDGAGAVQGFFCACGEITQAVLTARALRAERARLRSVLDGMGEGFGLLDRGFRIVELNEEAVRLDGRPREALLGRTHWDAYPGSEDSPLGALYRRAMERREAVALDHQYTFPDGRRAWLDMRAYPVPEGLAVFWRDITDRKEVERAAREARERMELALDAGAIIGTWDWRVPEDLFTADERFARSFGLDPADCRRGLALAQVVANVHPEDLPGLQAAIAGALARGGRCSHQYRVRHQDGAYRWLEANGRVELAPDGSPLRFPGVLLDIEARRAAEAERDRAVALLSAFAEAVPGVAYAKDREGRMLMANRGATELIGKPPGEYLGRTDAEFLEDKDQAAAVMANDRRIMESGVAEQVEEVVTFPGGRRATWLSTKAPLRDREGRVVGLIGSSVDITARVAAESALRDAEARLRRVLDGLFAFVGVLSPEGVLLEANAAPLEAAGLAPGDVLGRPFWDTHWWTHDPAVAARLRDAVAQAAAGQVVRYDARVRMKGGALTTIDFQLAPLRDAAGGLSSLVASGVVIEERVRAERELRELNETLERRVAAAIAERERVEEALRQSQKMEAVGQLTGGVAHDFNNLLTVVKGNIDMAQRALAAAGIEEPRARRALDGAMQGAERAAALTQRLLAFSRRQPLAPKPIDVDRLVLGMADMLNRTLGETVRLEIVTAPGLWRVEADPNQLEAAILNLAVNARDAMAAGGGTLTVETANARLDDGHAQKHAGVAPGQYVVVAVTDTGAGMPKEVLERAFEPFFTTKAAGAGTGLGLSQVYGFTKQSGGHVSIHSEPGQGTAVKIYLPRLLAPGEAEEEAAAPEGAGRRQETVLAVEDDDGVRAYTVECLRELGYRVLEAHDGPAALRLLERQDRPVDLLFTDVVMPGMSGRELADAARARQPGLRVLYTSGYTGDAIMHGGRLDAGVDMVPKPFTFAALSQAVRDALDRGRARRVLVAGTDAALRALALEALADGGYGGEAAATAGEVLDQVRAARGRYDAVVLDAALPDKPGDALLAELRALSAELPVLVAAEDPPAALVARVGADRCAALLPRPFTAARLMDTLRELTRRCRSD